MKTSLCSVLVALFVLLAVSASAQNLKTGNLVGLHVMTVELKEGVTMDQLMTFTQETYIPAYTKAVKGSKGYLIKAIRGEHNNQIGIMWIFRSEAVRDQYFTPDGQLTALGQEVTSQLAGVDAQRDDLATVQAEYTDWVVQ